MFGLLPALYMGWGIGAHDAANAFGPQIGANIISYRRAVILAAIFAVIGAVVEGQKVFSTLGGITHLIYQGITVAAAGRLDSVIRFQRIVRYAAVLVGCYAAYALGSNNMGNAMAPAVAVGLVGPATGAALGGAAMAVGGLTY